MKTIPNNPPKRYQIKITYPDGTIAYMTHKNRMQWCLTSAKKHLAEFVHLHGIHATLEEV